MPFNPLKRGACIVTRKKPIKVRNNKILQAKHKIFLYTIYFDIVSDLTFTFK